MQLPPTCDQQAAMPMQQRLTLMPRCLQLWDLRVETSPVATYKVHEFLRPKVRTYVRSQFVVTETKKKCFRISFWHQREDGKFFREKKNVVALSAGAAAVGALHGRLHLRQVRLLRQQRRGLLRYRILQVFSFFFY
jgi:hypothetical protein